ncbi:Uncharacterised protein [Klebsiella pneumoniae]|nr:Uncharacterised protein [Klebsiella pneumoniae]
MLYLALFVLYFLFCAGQCRTQERLSLCNETELTVFLAKRVFQRSDTGEIVVIHNRFYNAVMIFLQHCQCVKAGYFWLAPVQLIKEHGKL